MVRVRQLEGAKYGVGVKNQFVIFADDAIYFQSYSTVIAKYAEGTLTLGRDWEYSVTTVRNLYHFIRNHCGYVWYDIEDQSGSTTKHKIKKLIKSGEILYDGEMY